METIYHLVRNIVFIILLAVFVEMLLPMRESRRFLEVVVGLFVLVTILNPIVSLIRQEPFLEFEFEEGNKKELQMILDQGKELQQVQESQARDNYGKQLEEQIAVVACMVPGVEEAETSVQFATGSSMESVVAIEKIEIVIKQTSPQSIVEPVEKVSIGSGAGEEKQVNTGTQDVLQKVQKSVASFYGLQPETVVVTLE
ncbi:MAG: stage III sporulation protein AF [Syntrophaceticus sp.]